VLEIAKDSGHFYRRSLASGVKGCTPTHGFLAEPLAERNIEVAKHLLSARQVQTAPVGDLYDGAGLILRVKAKSASWIFRFTAPSGRRRELGLGSADRASLEAAGTSLKRARKNADEADLTHRRSPSGESRD